MPVRSTIARLTDGSLWVHSPPEPTPALTQALEALGPVRHIVAPSCLHHLHFGAFASHYPEARTYGAPGLARKREDLAFSDTLDASTPPEWASEIVPVPLEGAPRAGEVVFLHRPSGSLLVTDLVFNVTRPEGFMTHLVLGMTGTRGRLAKSRVWGQLVQDRPRFERSLARVLSLEFDRLIVAHGDVIDQGGREALRAALGHATARAPDVSTESGLPEH
jgi:hypothetical protein